MAMTDPIGDMLTRIRNAQLVRKEEVSMPCSKLKANVLKVLQKAGFIEDFKEQGEGATKKIVVSLRYENKRPAISHIERVSKPGRRIYSPKDEIPRVLQGRGLVIVSTSAGLMTGKEAKAKGVGGEIILKIY